MVVLHWEEGSNNKGKQYRKQYSGDRKYVGTPGLWVLILATTPDDKIFTNGDYDNYAEIMHSTNALTRNNDDVEGLDILMASKAAGNTGVRNELVSVCAELLRQNLIDKHTCKIIMLQLLKC